MALGRRPRKRSAELWVPTQDLAQSPGHPFYRALNTLFREERFDDHVEELCATFYREGKGRPSIPPGTYFRMLFIGYFEGLDSQRGIAWRCADSLSLREFLGLELRDRTPDHSSLTRIRQRLPLEVHQEVFVYVVGIAMRRGLLKGKRVGIDSTFLEANAAMKSITRKDSGESWKEYVRKLAAEEKEKEKDETDADGDPPDDQETRRFDRKRKGKRVSNKDWQSKTDPDAGIMRIKDGRTRLAYKAEHAVDLDADMVLAVQVTPGHHGDTATVMDTLTEAQAVLVTLDERARVEDLVMDKGYHKAEVLADCAERGIRTYVPERKQARRRKWTDKPPEWKDAVKANRRRSASGRGKKLMRQRAEKVERSFAHTCESGAARKSWLRGVDKVSKRYLMTAAALNLGTILRSIIGAGSPKGLAAACEALLARIAMLLRAITARWASITRRESASMIRRLAPVAKRLLMQIRPGTNSEPACSTAC